MFREVNLTLFFGVIFAFVQLFFLRGNVFKDKEEYSMLKDKNWIDLIFPFLFVLMRVLFGLGWLLAGVTKKLWFSEPGVFLNDYLLNSLGKENVPEFYKYLIKTIALENVMFFNFVIPIVQIAIGLSILLGLMTIPSILISLFMHINFILSGNMNLISLVLYTSAFSLLLGRKYIYLLSLDRYLGIEKLFILSHNTGINHAATDRKRSIMA
jgi:thiosulfate dehydrogenase [quinone] large subunit